MAFATRLPGERNLDADDADRIAAVRERIIAVGDEWRARHPWLNRNQNAIGLAIFLVSMIGIAADAVLYGEGILPWFVVIPITAFWLSLLHELEHDLIHWMYFRRRKWVHHSMMLGVWLVRPSTINPWVRRRLHMHHHRVSGTDSDLEEQAITNGLTWGPHRLISLLDSLVGIYLRPLRMRHLVQLYAQDEARDEEEARQLVTMNRLAYLPLGAFHYTLWHLWIGVHLFALFGGHLPSSGGWASAISVLDFITAVLLAPNFLRTFCLHFVSSNMHYFGDVEPNNVLKQTQVWTAKRMWPVHAFCFNFGGTHAIHHFLVRDTFYVRQLIAKDCQQILRDNGVRFNDFGTFRRSNRWTMLVPAHVEP